MSRPYIPKEVRSTIAELDLKLNNSLIVKARTRWVMAGWHPPANL